MRLLHIALSHGDNGLTRALRGVSSEYREVPTSAVDLRGQILAVVDSFSPECIWIQIQSEGLTEEILQKLLSSNAYVINWSGDVRLPIPEFYFRYGKYVDMTCFSNMHDVLVMRGLGYRSEFLQIGYDQDIYNREIEIDYTVPEIVFQANNHRQFPLSKQRAEMVQFLKHHYGDRFGVYGNGWYGMESGNSMGDQRREARIYRSARIAINISNFNYSRYSSDRLFRAMGTGVCVLSHRYQDYEVDFQEGVNILTWSTLDELKKQIDDLLIRHEYRQEIGRNGLEYVKKYFTFDEMAKNIRRLWEENR